MNLFYIIIKIFIVIILILLLYIMFRHFYSNIMDKRKQKRLEKWRLKILESLFDKGEIKLKNRIDEEMLSAIIEHINAFTGDYRKRLIKAVNKSGLIDEIFHIYRNTKSQYKKEYYLYILGELRCKKHLKSLLEEDIIKLGDKNLLISYFFALVVIVNEWIFDISERFLRRYLEKIIEIMEYMEKSDTWNIKRLMDYFLNGSENFFVLAVDNFEYVEYFIKKMYDSTLSLETRGNLIYIISSNREYNIIKFIENEFYKYINKERTNEEDEYLISIIKAISKLGLESSNDLLLEAAESENWVMRSEAIKGLGHFQKNKDLVYMKLFDKSWWVRYNAARSLVRYGQEGINYLFEALASNVEDKYAKEISAYALVNSNYLDIITKITDEGNFSSIFDDILLIINNGNNMRIFDKIINTPSLGNTIKIDLIKSIKSEKLRSYYLTILKPDLNIDKELKLAIEKQIKLLKLEE